MMGGTTATHTSQLLQTQRTSDECLIPVATLSNGCTYRSMNCYNAQEGCIVISRFFQVCVLAGTQMLSCMHTNCVCVYVLLYVTSLQKFHIIIIIIIMHNIVRTYMHSFLCFIDQKCYKRILVCIIVHVILLLFLMYDVCVQFLTKKARGALQVCQYLSLMAR